MTKPRQPTINQLNEEILQKFEKRFTRNGLKWKTKNVGGAPVIYKPKEVATFLSAAQDRSFEAGRKAAATEYLGMSQSELQDKRREIGVAMSKIDQIIINWDHDWDDGGSQPVSHIEDKLEMLRDKVNELIEHVNGKDGEEE